MKKSFFLHAKIMRELNINNSKEISQEPISGDEIYSYVQNIAFIPGLEADHF